MKRLFLGIMILVAAFSALSCGEDTPGGSSDSPFIISDSRLVGHWLINRYDAYDGEGKLVNTTDDGKLIKEGYWRIDMTAEGSMYFWYGEYSQAAVSTSFYFEPSLNKLYFGDTGEMMVTTLSDTSFVFNSDNIMPLEWYEKLYSGEYKYVTTACMKEKN